MYPGSGLQTGNGGSELGLIGNWEIFSIETEDKWKSIFIVLYYGTIKVSKKSISKIITNIPEKSISTSNRTMVKWNGI